MKPAVAVMARVPGAGPVKSRLHAALGAEGAARLYRCFHLAGRPSRAPRTAAFLAAGAGASGVAVER